MQLIQSRVVRSRVAHAAAGLGLLAALGVSAPTGTAQAQPPVDPACEPGGAASSARVMPGHQGIDPNSLSAAQAADLQAQLQQRLDRPAVRARMDARGVRGGQVRGIIKIRTFVHVITAEDGTGAVTRRQIGDQMKVINAAFAGRTARPAARSPFRFVVADVDVTANDDWYAWPLNDDLTESPTVIEAKRALHRGGFRDLNIYVASLSGGLLGYAFYPGTVPVEQDGLVILNESMPGGAAAPFNQGDTATHEIGHWLNLAHTFNNGCEKPGDYVRDTPYQANGENIFYCGDWPGDGITARPDDTCPQPGKDPAHNFMSYGDDTCLDRFTPGQMRRSIRSWFAYRAGR